MSFWTRSCSIHFTFPSVKVLDLVHRFPEFEVSSNPFGKIAAATIFSKQTKKNPSRRREYLFRLVRSLYHIGYSSTDVRLLFHLLGWILKLPKPEKLKFYSDLMDLEPPSKAKPEGA